MQDIIQQVEGTSEFKMVWRIPFERDNKIAMQNVCDHVMDIICADCWAVGTSAETFFNFYPTEPGSSTYKIQRDYRDNVLSHDISCLFECAEKVYIVLGGQPFRYITIEYNGDGLGILTDFQILP